MYNQVSNYWADYVSKEEWNLTATIRPFKYKLNETNAFDLASRLMRYKDIIKSSPNIMFVPELWNLVDFF